MTLVSVIIPTYNRTALLMGRALPSVLAQTHAELDIHVVGDGTEQATVDAMAAVPRVRFTNLPHADYPDDLEAYWCAIGVPAINHGLDTARGEWVTVLADDDAYPPDRIALMLAAADASDAECIVGRTEIVGFGMYGSASDWTDGAFLLRASLGYRYDAESWKRGVIADYDLRRRLVADGVRIAFIPDVVYRYWPAHKVPPVSA